MADYKIMGVAKDVREWSSAKGGPMKSYTMKLEGVDEPVEWSRKASSEPPKIFDTLAGTIETTQYGKKFKMDYQPGPGGGGGGRGAPRDDAAIKAQFAIKAAVQALPEAKTANLVDYLADVEALAQGFYTMVERVKATPSDEPQQEVKGLEKVYDPDEIEEVKLEDPFEGFDFGTESERANG